MARWNLIVNDEIAFRGNSDSTDTRTELAAFMSRVYDNQLPGPFPSSEVFDKGNWKHLVRASMLLVSEFYGIPEIRPFDFDVDDLIVILPPAPKDAVF